MRHFAGVSGWEFRFVTSSNLTDYLTEESKTSLRKITTAFK
jgi:hypothetical protein